MDKTEFEVERDKACTRIVADVFENTFFETSNNPDLRASMEARARSFENGFKAGAEWAKRQEKDPAWGSNI